MKPRYERNRKKETNKTKEQQQQQQKHTKKQQHSYITQFTEHKRKLESTVNREQAVNEHKLLWTGRSIQTHCSARYRTGIP